MKYVDDNLPLKVGPQTKNSGITAYFIKYYMLMSASGFVGPPVYVIADDNMNNLDIDVYSVPDLSLSVDAEKAYLVFCKSRACNYKFYDWFNSTILFNFIDSIKKRYDYADGTVT